MQYRNDGFNTRIGVYKSYLQPQQTPRQYLTQEINTAIFLMLEIITVPQQSKDRDKDLNLIKITKIGIPKPCPKDQTKAKIKKKLTKV